jgi:hypothetical protein
MAFNPFHGFRKHNKVVFAGLTILCMFVFVLSSGMGGGDFFTQITDAISGRMKRTTLVSLDGEQFSARDIDLVNYQRRMANDYMDGAIAVARNGLDQRLNKTVEQLPPDAQRKVQELYTTRYIALMTRDVQQVQRAYYNSLVQLQQADSEKKTDLANALGTMRRLLELDFAAVANRRTGERFFGMTDNDKIDDTVNFLVWRQQADKLGVRLTDADVNTMIAEETGGELTKEAADILENMMQEKFRNGYTAEGLFNALRDEFRVRIAQLSLTGSCSGVGRYTLTAAPVQLTPQESWDLFKDARTTVRVGMIDLPVKDFIAQVKDTPGEDDLKKLFEKYKNDEPSPDRDLPAFKEPRRIGVEWVGANADSPYYRTAADTVLAVLPALRLLGNIAPASQVLMPVQFDAELFAQEEAWRKQQTQWWEPMTGFRPRLDDSSLARPEAAVALITGAAGPFGAISGPLAMEATATRREAEVRLKFGVSMIGLATAPDPLGIFAGPVAGLPHTTLAQARPQLLAKAKTELINGSRDVPSTQAAGLVASDLYSIRGEIMKLGREKGKDDVEKYVAGVVKERGLEHGRTSEPRDQYHLSDDAGLAPLKQAYQKANGTRDLLLKQFGPAFFRDQSQEVNAPDGPFIPHRYVVTGQADEPQFYWWRTEDVPPKTPKFDKARAEVVEAWKLIRARDLAKKDADRILDELQKTPRTAANLKDAAAQNGNREVFDLSPMAVYMPQLLPTQVGTLSRDYATLRPGMTPEQIAQAYNIPADRIAYPDAEMVQDILKLREDPAGKTIIVSDKPKLNYYVTTLLQRQEPTQEEFQRSYRGSMARATEFDSLLARLTAGRPEEYRKGVLAQLREQSKVVIQESARQRGREPQ